MKADKQDLKVEVRRQEETRQIKMRQDKTRIVQTNQEGKSQKENMENEK